MTRVLELDDLSGDAYRAWSLADLFDIFRRRAVWVFYSVGLLLLLVSIYCFIATRRYQATGEVEVQKETLGGFGLESSVMGDAEGSASDALDYNVTLQTQANILQSETLALEVIHDLNLETTKDFYPQHSSGFHLPAWVYFWKKSVEPLSVPLADAPNRRYIVLKIFASHLKVTPVTGTRLIDVSYSDPDPVRAARVVNHLIQALTDYTFQARFTATAQASSWLTSQLEDLKQQTERLQAKAIRLQRDTGMFGDDESHNIVLSRLESLNGALAAAESNRILKEAIDRTAQGGDPEMLSALSGNASPGGVTPMQNSLALIQTLRAQEAQVKAEMAQAETRYGLAYPRVAELKAELSGVQRSIAEEVKRIGARAHSDFEIAQRTESAARVEMDKQKAIANQLNDKAIAYALAKQEADESRNLYESLLNKLKQAGVLEGLRSSNLTVVNPGRVPSSNHPKSPNIPLYYAAALAAGLFFGCTGAVARELTDHSIRSLKEVETFIGTPLFSVIPVSEPRQGMKRFMRANSAMADQASLAVAGKRSVPQLDLQAVHAADSPFAESLRSLRTSLMLSRSSKPPQVILITSSVAGEGKSTLALNLAAVLAQQNSKVLLVDADLRCPVLHKRVGAPEKRGLSAMLASETLHPNPYRLKQLPNLSLMFGGPVPPFPAEMLGSRRMRDVLHGWREDYDFIVLDSPPVLPVTDAVVLSQIADATLLVTRHGMTTKQALQRSHQALVRQLPEQAVLGVVLNAVCDESADFYEYYGYRGSSYGAAQA